MPEEHKTKPSNIYPTLTIHQNANPHRLYALPLIGFLTKIVLLIPIFFEAFFLTFAFLFLWIINSFYIVFTGKYWDTAYKFFLGFMQFTAKIYLYLYGLIDKYPGFRLNSDNLFELHIPKPEKPNPLFAIPLLGFIARIVLLIPYYIFSQIMKNGSWVAMCIAWFPILFYGKFPESVYEFEKDSLRVNLAAFSYITGLSDKYPSFSISMNHQTIKILLIIAGTLLTFNNLKNNLRQNNYPTYNRYQHNIHPNFRNQMYRGIPNQYPPSY